MRTPFNLLGPLIICASPAGSVALEAAPPSVVSVAPHGAQRGAQVTLVVEGDGLESALELISSLSSPAELVALEEGLRPTRNRAAFRFTLSNSEVPGPRLLRVRTSDGLSNPFLFCVGVLPEVLEVEPNDAFDAAAQLVPPVTVNGRLGPTDRDLFLVHARAGERLVFEVESRRIGSSVDPTLHLYRADGREIALGEDTQGLDVDARIDQTFIEAGNYWIEVHDATYATRSPDFYRLRMGDFAYAEAVFPPGGRAGSDLEVSLDGGSLAAPVLLRARLPNDLVEAWIPISLPPNLDLGGSFPLRLRVGDLPEVTESAAGTPVPIVPPVTVNGRIGARDEVDGYTIECSPGQALTLSIDAARLGSWLDAVLTVRREDGTPIATADDEGLSPDPVLDFTVPEGVSRLRVEVRDLHRRGGKAFAYRLTARPRQPDFELRILSAPQSLPLGGTALVEVECVRRGYAGAIQLRLWPEPEGFNLRGGEILPGQTKGYVSLTGPRSGALRALEFSVSGTGGTSEAPISRRARGTLFLSSEHGTPSSPVEFGAIATAVSSPPALALRAQVETIEVAAGNATTLPLRVERRGEAMGELQITALGLPPGVKAAEARIGAGELTGSILLEAAPGAALQEGDGVVRAVMRSGGQDLTAPAPVIRVRVVKTPDPAVSGESPAAAPRSASRSKGENRR